jgi:Subtilase family
MPGSERKLQSPQYVFGTPTRIRVANWTAIGILRCRFLRICIGTTAIVLVAFVSAVTSHQSGTAATLTNLEMVELEAPSTSGPSAATSKVPEDLDSQRRERDIKQKELDVREHEADKALALARSPWWQRADPLLLAIIAAILTMIGNMLVALFNNRSNIRQELTRSTLTLKQERQKADDALRLERQKARYTLILQAIGTGDSTVAEQNIRFFIDAGLLEDEANRIASALARFRPVLPSPGGEVRSQPFDVPDIGRIYNFPSQCDGGGQVVGVMEFGGGYRPAELADYFAAANLPMPEITDVSVDDVANNPGTAADAEVMLNIEVVGAIAPKAAIRVYFSSFTEKGWVEAVSHAVADRVSVLLVCWGRSEAEWKRPELEAVDRALRAAAESGITVVAAAGDRGATNGAKDGRPHVLFPASSPWVLAVGGSTVVTSTNRLVSETVWNDAAGATGGGVSDVFERPSWQAAVKVPARRNGRAGRGIPDVAAIASPSSGARVLIAGTLAVIGGTSLSASVWAGFIALVNQGLGRNLGYLNPMLYQEIGPAGVLRSITEGNNGLDGGSGYSAGPGWNPVAGWGAPDGLKLLERLRSET